MANLPKTYHDLKEWAIAHFRIQGGYIAPNMPVNEDFSDIRMELRQKGIPHRRYGRKVQIVVIEVQTEMCFSCCSEFRKLFPTIWFRNKWDEGNCQCCGMRLDDDIPF